MSALQDYLKYKLAPLKEKVTLNKRTFEGGLSIQRKHYTDKQVAELVELGNRPGSDTIYYRNRMAHLKNKFGGLELETKPVAKAEQTVECLATARTEQEQRGFIRRRGIVEESNGSLRAMEIQIKL